MKNIVDKADAIVEAKQAKFIKDFEGLRVPFGYVTYGHFEGYGIRTEDVCLDATCRYRKYTNPIWVRAMCTHPDVENFVKIGGVYRCPDSWKPVKLKWARLIRNLRRLLK